MGVAINFQGHEYLTLDVQDILKNINTWKVK